MPTIASTRLFQQVVHCDVAAANNSVCRRCKVVPLCWHCLDHHDSYECQTLGGMNLSRTFFLDHLDVLTPLRVLLLLLQQTRTDKTVVSDQTLQIDLDEILCMESHCTIRRDTMIWQLHAKNVVKPMLEAGILSAINARNQLSCVIDADFVQKICGILDVNTFEVRTPNFEVSFHSGFGEVGGGGAISTCVTLDISFQEFPVRGLYCQAALLAHDCIGNTFITVDNDRQLKIFAAVDIACGEIIYNNYTATLYVR